MSGGSRVKKICMLNLMKSLKNRLAMRALDREGRLVIVIYNNKN